eukprot:121533_1
MADNSDDSMHCGWKFLIGTLALLTVAGSAYGLYIAFIAAPVCATAPDASVLPDSITNVAFVDAPACKGKTECALQCNGDSLVNPLTNTDAPQKAVCKKGAAKKKNSWDVSKIKNCVPLCDAAPLDNFLATNNLNNVVFVNKAECAGKAQCPIQCKRDHDWVTTDPTKTLE